MAAAGTNVRAATIERSGGEPFGYCINTSTIREQKLELPKIVDLAATAGYSGIEPWIGEIQKYIEDGGSLPDLKKRIQDHGLTVESAIGFANWIVDDAPQRAQGLEQLRRDMELVAGIGGTRIAAPPAGATNQPDLDLLKAARRYREALKVGEQTGVVPEIELWGFSQSLHRLGELMMVAVEAAHPDACLLPDVYHVYRGGSDFEGLSLIDGKSIHVFHVNDYPGNIPREKLTDADRVYPGDGVAPITKILQTLHKNGFRGALSLELFNREYWKQDPATVLRTGLEKMRAVVQASGLA